jgi:ATP dependent DNA ligase domain
MLPRALPAGFVSPCLPTKTDKLPSGSEWLHEIKHDGFRVIARKKGPQVRLYSRLGTDLTHRFPLIVETLARLRARSWYHGRGQARMMEGGLPASVATGNRTDASVSTARAACSVDGAQKARP